MRTGEAARRYLPHSRGEADYEIDWEAAPARFKRYRAAERLPLDWESDYGPSRLLRELYGLTRTRWSYPFWASSWLATSTSKESHGFPAKVPPLVADGRPIPSGGALYPSEVYLACGRENGRPAALYHYDPAHHALDTVRLDDHRAALAECLAVPGDSKPGLVLILTTRFWRTAFKYREFSYRPQAQETGVLIAQALCLADFRVHLCFDDQRVDLLLGLDSFRETTMAVLTLGTAGETGGPAYSELVAVATANEADPPPSIVDTLPAMTALHAAVLAGPNLAAAEITFPPSAPHLTEGMAFRASPRNGFARRPIDDAHLVTMLSAAVGPRTSVYCVVNNVHGLTPGAYRYDADAADGALVLTNSAVSGMATRWAPWTRLAFHEAAVAVFVIGDYERGIAAFGDRWVRIQHIEAGVMIHRAALAAAAVGLASRINSDGTTSEADSALGLTGTAKSLTMLLVGRPRPGASVDSASRPPPERSFS